MDRVFDSGVRLAQVAGFFLLVLLAAYLYLSIHWAGQRRAERERHGEDGHSRPWLAALKLVAAIAGVAVSAQVVIPGATGAASSPCCTHRCCSS